MSETKKIIELVKRLEESFPEDYVTIRKDYCKHTHNNFIAISFTVYVESGKHSPDLYGITALESYIDTIIINKVNKES